MPDEHWQRNRETAEAAAALQPARWVEARNHACRLSSPRAERSCFDKLCGRIVEIAQFYAQIGGFLLLETGGSADTLLAFLGELAKRGAGNVTVNFDPPT